MSWANNRTAKMIPVRTAIMENTLWQQMNKNLAKLERQMSPK